MSELTEQIQLTFEQRELLLKYAFPSTRLLASGFWLLASGFWLLASLRRWPKGQPIRRV
jgi:hypothetical protein